MQKYTIFKIAQALYRIWKLTAVNMQHKIPDSSGSNNLRPPAQLACMDRHIHNTGPSESFEVNVGLHQRSVLLFAVVILWIHILHTVHWTDFDGTAFPLTPQGHLADFTIIFPSLLPTITLDFPAFTLCPLTIMLALDSATGLPSCSIIGAVWTRSSAYSNSEGIPLFVSLGSTSMTTANSSELNIDYWCIPTFKYTDINNIIYR